MRARGAAAGTENMTEAGIEARLDSARALHRQGLLAEARGHYQAVLATSPDHADTLHLLGVMQLQTGAAEAGVRLISRAVGPAPGMAKAHNNLAHGLLALGRAREALASVGQAVLLDPAFRWSRHSAVWRRVTCGCRGPACIAGRRTGFSAVWASCLQRPGSTREKC
jgi:tetratricopeptide (TPR) repeat protein